MCDDKQSKYLVTSKQHFTVLLDKMKKQRGSGDPLVKGLSQCFLTNRTDTATITNARAAVMLAAMLPTVMSIFQCA